MIGLSAARSLSNTGDLPVPGPIVPPPLVVNIRDFGAKGDGMSNDSAAFRAASAKIEGAGGGTLVIPSGTYVVGEQTVVPGGPFYGAQPIFTVKNVDGLVIEGNGATLRFAEGLRFGAFDQEGKRVDPALPFTDRNQAAEAGSMIEILNSRNVEIRNLELDGNAGQFVLGGEWGDKGRQLRAYGLRLFGNSNVVIKDVDVHHQALDGMIIGWDGYTASDTFATPHFLQNVKSEYNARQGLSWVGGRGLTATKSKFSHSGRGPFASSPAAGLDIEAEGSVCRDGLFSECEFINNVNCGIVADSGDGGYTTFVKCMIWGTTNFSIWVTKPGVLFRDCVIYGTVVHAFGSDDPKLATRYEGCYFEDPENKEFESFRGTALIHIDGGRKNVTIENCTIVANRTGAFWLDGSSSEEKGCFVVKNCKITHLWQEPANGIQSLFRNVVFENTSFSERDLPGPSVIIAQDVFVKDNVLVEGPFCTWGRKDGETGDISRGVWNEGQLLLSDESWESAEK